MVTTNICTDVWDVALGEILPCINEDGNLHDPYTVLDGEVHTCTKSFLAIIQLYNAT